MSSRRGSKRGIRSMAQKRSRTPKSDCYRGTLPIVEEVPHKKKNAGRDACQKSSHPSRSVSSKPSEELAPLLPQRDSHQHSSGTTLKHCVTRTDKDVLQDNQPLSDVDETACDIHVTEEILFDTDEQQDLGTIPFQQSMPTNNTVADHLVTQDVHEGNVTFAKDTKPVLGVTYHSVAEEARRCLPSLTKQSEKLLELQSILTVAGCPRGTFDEVVKVIEEGVMTEAFRQETPIPRLQSFLSDIQKTYPCMEPEQVCVHLETPPKKNDDNKVRSGQFDKAYLFRWDFGHLIKRMLEDVLLMGDPQNLVVNPDDPFGKYDPGSDPNASHGEVMASQWYRDTYDKLVTDPTTQIVIPIIIYLDKTGTDLKQKYGVEPIAFTIGILRQKMRHLVEAWRVLGYMPDLELSSSAARKANPKNNSSSARSARNYHKCLDEVLSSLKKLQKGFKTLVRIGDKLKYMTVFCPVAFVVGDGKSSDMLCCRRATKSKCRVSRYCITPANKLDDPMHKCECITMDTLKDLVVLANDEATTKQERKKVLTQLHDLSTHNVYNAFFDVDFGANPFGIISAATPDLMHMFELGILKYVLRIFIDSMPPSIRAQVDQLMDKMFVKTRSSEKKDSLRYDFTRGATSLTLLNAHHWPGLTMAFLVMLLTKEGQGICRGKCFRGEEAEIPSHPLSAFPHFDGNPTELTVEGMLAHLSLGPPQNIVTENSTVAMDVDPEGEELMEENSTDKEGNTSDEEDGEAEQEELPEEPPAEVTEETTEGPPKKKRKMSQPLPCTLRQFVLLLERLLVFHAWYKNGSPFSLSSTPAEKKAVWKKIRELMQNIKCIVPRDDGCGWQLQKFHDLLHILLALEQFGDTDNFDASHGERMLKYWVKYPGITCQKRGQHRFLQQMSNRISESMSLREAHLSKATSMNRKEAARETSDHNGSFLIGSASCRVDRDSQSGNVQCTWLRKANKQRCKTLHPCVLTYLKKNFETHSQEGKPMFFYTEAEHKGITLRAHPDYTQSGSGPWYDFAMLHYEEGRHGIHDYPARILAFFKGLGNDGTEDSFAIVQSVDYLENNEKVRRQKLQTTDIACRWQMESSWGRRRTGDGKSVTCYRPRIRCVSLKTIQSGALVFEEEPGIQEFTDSPQIVWSLSNRRDEWHRHF